MIAAIKQRYYSGTALIVRPLAALGIRPNHLTVTGLLLVCVAAAFIASGQLVLGGILALLTTAFDTLDGSLARATNQVTKFGDFFDATLDRYADLILLAALFPSLPATDVWTIAAYFAAIAGTVAVPYAKARAEANGVRCDVGIFPREARVLAYAAGVILGWIVPLVWLLAVLTNLTAAQRILHVRRELTRR